MVRGALILVLTLGVLALGNFVIGEETKPEPIPGTISEEDIPELVKEYEKCPISLRKYAKAFLDLANQYWWVKNWEKSAKSFDQAAKIYNDIIQNQTRRSRIEKNRKSYREFIDYLNESRVNALVMKARCYLEMDNRKAALRELIVAGRKIGLEEDEEFQASKAVSELLLKEFGIDKEDLKDLGLEKIYH